MLDIKGTHLIVRDEGGHVFPLAHLQAEIKGLQRRRDDAAIAADKY